jgi:hypothetical protein
VALFLGGDMDDVSDAAVAQARIEELTRERDEARWQLRTALYHAKEAAEQWQAWHEGEQERQGIMSEGLIDAMWELNRAVDFRLPRRQDVPLPVLQGESWAIHAGGSLTAQQYAEHYFGVA